MAATDPKRTRPALTLVDTSGPIVGRDADLAIREHIRLKGAVA